MSWQVAAPGTRRGRGTDVEEWRGGRTPMDLCGICEKQSGPQGDAESKARIQAKQTQRRETKQIRRMAGSAFITAILSAVFADTGLLHLNVPAPYET